MFKRIIFAAVLMTVGVTFAPPANAGTFCNQLGSNPSLDTAEQVMWNAVVNNVDSTVFATDIVDNCPSNYNIVMQAAKSLHNKLTGA